ncbi:S41 family peptidase [Candidatus Neomarinimicrobiota bacterium]
MRYKSLGSNLFILVAFLSTTLLLYPTDISAQVPWPSPQETGPPADFNYIPKKPGHYTIEDWATVIDTTWGPGLPDTTKLKLFDEAWNKLNAEYAAFQNLDVDWDSLRDVYRPEVEAGVSRGRFAAIMNHLGFKLQETHTCILDIPVNYGGAPLEPGIPLFVAGARQNESHFGASLTPLPDSSLLVYNTLPDHPLGLVPGDIVLGYDGIPWRVLYKELLAAELPFYQQFLLGLGWWVSTESAMTHQLLMSAGWNWHLFDTLDVVKYATGGTVHYPTNLLEGQSGFIWGNEQLPVPGVPWLDIGPGENPKTPSELGDYISWGVIEDTQVGYIYAVAWLPFWQPRVGDEFYEAVDALMNHRETEGLIIDLRLNYGGEMGIEDPGLALLFNSSVLICEYAKRCGDPNDHFEMCTIEDNLHITGSPTTFFDRPIAVLTGPGAVSMGDETALKMKFHPMARLFGKPTAGAFSIISWGDLMGNPDWFLAVTIANSYLVSDSGNYLNHTELEIDEEVWLTKDDVARGEDTVVKRAIEWIQNLAYAHDVTIDPTYLAPGTGTTTINAQVEDPNDHTLSVVAKIISNDSTMVDSVSLVDDGLHDDGEAGDGLWGAFWGPVPDSENSFFTSVTTMDSTDSTTRTIPNVAWFTTIGPVNLHSCTTPWYPDPPRPGDDIYFAITLRNNSSTVPVTNISAVITPEIDTLVLALVSPEFSFGDITPGDTTSVAYYSVRFSEYIPGNSDFRFYMSISSEGYAFWVDTFSIHINHPVEVADEKGALPTEYALHQSYPNPFNPVSTIRYDLLQSSEVSLIVYDILGREVTKLVDSYMEPGYHQTIWDSRNSQGRELPSGIYIARLITPEYTKSIKMLLLR